MKEKKNLLSSQQVYNNVDNKTPKQSDSQNIPSHNRLKNTLRPTPTITPPDLH